MNDLYRIGDHVEHTHKDVPPSMCVRCMIDLHIEDGELIPVVPDYEAAAKALDGWSLGDAATWEATTDADLKAAVWAIVDAALERTDNGTS